MPILRLPTVIAAVTASNATVLRWLKQQGQSFAKGDLLVQLELVGSTLQIEAPEAGTLKRVMVAAGKTVALGGDLAEFTAGAAAAIPITAAQSNQGVTTMTKPASTGKATPILMPQAGNTMEEGRLVLWKVKRGDRIAVGQVICEIETDKATIEFEGTDAGRLARIVAPEGAVVPVKQPIAFLAENDADVDAYMASSGSQAADSAPPSSASVDTSPAAVASAPAPARPADGRIKASPAARKIAADKGLDLSTIAAGSGPGGRILSTDLAGASASTARAATAIATTAAGTVARKPLSKMRRAIANNLRASKQTIPHFYITQTIEADPLFAFYRAQKPATGCTLNDVVLLAVGRCVFDFPAFRSRIEGSDIVELPSANIGVAVSVEDGLVVPVVMAIEGHSLSTLPAETKRVVEAARKGRLENVGKGVFTISNMGMLGVEDFSAIINPPESGILAISAVREAVIVKDGAMRAGRVMSMTLSVDHRVVDGAMAAAFMAKLKERLEKPESLL